MTLFAEFMTPMADVTHASRNPGQPARLSGPAVAAGHLRGRPRAQGRRAELGMEPGGGRGRSGERAAIIW